MTINSMDTVRELATTLPNATWVFEQLGIDYCCGGERTLEEACRVADRSVAEVVRLLEQATATKQDEPWHNWQKEPLTALITYILDKHHVFTKQEVNRLEQLLAKVCSVHGQNHPELLRLQMLFQGLKQELIQHMLKEEQVLFPYIERLEQAVSSRQAVPLPFFGTVRNPVRMMIIEHEAAGEVLRQMRQVSHNYSVPDDACTSFQTLYQALPAFEASLHQHIHLENNLLFPRAVEMERGVESTWQSTVDESSEHRCFGH